MIPNSSARLSRRSSNIWASWPSHRRHRFPWQRLPHLVGRALARALPPRRLLQQWLPKAFQTTRTTTRKETAERASGVPMRVLVKVWSRWKSRLLPRRQLARLRQARARTWVKMRLARARWPTGTQAGTSCYLVPCPPVATSHMYAHNIRAARREAAARRAALFASLEAGPLASFLREVEGPSGGSSGGSTVASLRLSLSGGAEISRGPSTAAVDARAALLDGALQLDPSTNALPVPGEAANRNSCGRYES